MSSPNRNKPNSSSGGPPPAKKSTVSTTKSSTSSAPARKPADKKAAPADETARRSSRLATAAGAANPGTAAAPSSRAIPGHAAAAKVGSSAITGIPPHNKPTTTVGATAGKPPLTFNHGRPPASAPPTVNPGKPSPAPAPAAPTPAAPTPAAPTPAKTIPLVVKTSHLQDVLKVTEAKDAREKATNIRNALKAEFEKPTKNFAVLDDLLEAGKVVLVKLFSPVETKVNPEDSILARDILEFGAKISVQKKSELGLAQFEAYVCQLKHYYLDLKHFLKTPSESMYEILGMYLMYLLSRNLISTFHVELETFIHPNVRDVLSNVYIKKAVEIEQYLTDGRFNKILALHLASEDDLRKEGLNSIGFKFFIDRLFEYSREIIADVMESSADSISATKAQSKLHIQDPQALVLYCQKRNWEHKKDGHNKICFKRCNVEGKTLPSMQLAQDALFYAKELDTIV